MNRFLIVTFLQDHIKPVLLWAVGGGIWIADAVTELANGAFTTAERVGDFSTTTLLALISIILGFYIYKREVQIAKKDSDTEERLAKLIDRNTDAMEGNTDALQDLRTETQRQTKYFEDIGKTLVERGLGTPTIPNGRKNTSTTRSQS